MATRHTKTKSNRPKFLWIAVAVAILFLAAFASTAYLHAVKCRNLAALQLNNFRQYRLYHNGHYPSDIGTLSQACFLAFEGKIELSEPLPKVVSTLCCPAVKYRTIEITNATNESDYRYINWEPMFGTNHVPTNYPIFFDRHIKNHRFGVNVLIFGGDIFWDFNAEWLKRFAAEHPSYKIVTPD